MQAQHPTPTKTPNREFVYEKSQTAGRMEAIMLIVSAIAAVAAVFAFLSYGWLPSIALFILGALAFGLSRLFDLIGELFDAIDGRNGGQ